ncbi:D-glycero-beta-D-manno-heptose 1,7-bisphosphate 7-phosphatase [Neptunicella sp.]|uniref:D-glycero-beta-D-manno-heptose 1,7-bisphosphate 7-phosphatase n=1 Tax=Neptunicella sp. TaxID=2125986 RepID=UPI003F68CE9E
MKNKAVFLDRDGVINVDHGYTIKIDDFEFIDGVFESCKILQELGYLLVVVTNQSGIARGFYNEQQLAELHQWMVEQFRHNGVDIAGVYYCPHHAQHGSGEYLQACDCRKPQPGMLLKAAAELDIDLSQSVIVGDKESDLQAGKNAGLQSLVLVGDKISHSRLADEQHVSLGDWLLG